MRIETTAGKRIVATTSTEAALDATYRFVLQMPDGTTIDVAGTIPADARVARSTLIEIAGALHDAMIDAGWFPGGLRQIEPERDPYTMALELCGRSGLVDLVTLNRLRGLTGLEPYDGEPFICTGHAHLDGEHILCTSVAHREARAAERTVTVGESQGATHGSSTAAANVSGTWTS